MKHKGGLGRGLDALIPGGEFSAEQASSPGSEVLQIPIQQIHPNPHQPRSTFDAQELAELADSIRQHGIIQPLLVTRTAESSQYTLIAGERRLLAARQAGLENVPAIVREATQQDLVELALIENVQRADLSPLETAEAYRRLVEEFGLPHEEVARRVGKNRTTVTNTLRLLKLPASIQQALAKGEISEGHARALLALNTQQAQIAALQSILTHQLNVRQTEELVQKLNGLRPAPQSTPSLPPEFTELEQRLRSELGTKVTLHRGRKGGTLVIHYYSDEELDALVSQILHKDSA